MNIFEQSSRIPPEVLKEAMSKEEYQPPLCLDEPKPGGGGKKLHQDLSFGEEE